MPAPIIITVYNRLHHFKRSIHALRQCELASESLLYISSDAAFRKEDEAVIMEIRDFATQITGFKEVILVFHEVNKGLIKSYYSVVDKIFEKTDRFIFLEDDVIVAPDFLTYMNEGLSFYEKNKRVFSISAFSFSLFSEVPASDKNQVYFANRFLPWGFGIWKDRILFGSEYTLSDLKRSLNEENFIQRLHKNGSDLHPALLSLVSQSKVPALDYLSLYHMVKHDLVTVSPYVSKSFNIGNDGSGTRTSKNAKFEKVDTTFLEKPNPYEFTNDIDQAMDYRFYSSNFNSKKNTYKIILDRLGLLGVTMKVVNFYKKHF